MAKSTDSKEQTSPSYEADQILHLKRLLVTMKQHYEKSLHSSQFQLQVEQNQRIATQKELEDLQSQLTEKDKLHEEELQALRNQQSSLKELLKKNQEELKLSKDSVSLNQEFETVKKGPIHESKALETRYIEVLNEKIKLEHNYQQLQHQLEHQSSNLFTFQAQIHRMEEQNKELEAALHGKENELSRSFLQTEELQQCIYDFEERIKEKHFVQDKYEQLKDEWNQLGERLEEAVEIRAQAEQNLIQLEAISSKQTLQIGELKQQLQDFQEEKKGLEGDRDQLKILFDESETRLKVAQQHLAKKVKEVALLTERVEQLQNNLSEFTSTFEQQKTQVAQLQANVDLFQKQEKKLQEQLHDALKGTESQVSKWEEKYFRMHDKWQESENRIRELKKIEEKHFQMQNLIANLGNFIGTPLASVNCYPNQEGGERFPKPLSFDPPVQEGYSQPPKLDREEDKYDLFGMRQPHERYKPNSYP